MKYFVKKVKSEIAKCTENSNRIGAITSLLRRAISSDVIKSHLNTRFQSKPTTIHQPDDCN